MIKIFNIFISVSTDENILITDFSQIKPVARNFYREILLNKMWTFLAKWWTFFTKLLNEIEDIFSKIMAF